MLYSRTSLLIHSKCISLHLLTPNSQSIPLPPPAPCPWQLQVCSLCLWICFYFIVSFVPFATTWMQLEVIILSEVSQKEKDKHYLISLICTVWKNITRSSPCGSVIMNLTSIHEDAGLIPGLAHWFKGSGVTVSCGVGHRCGSYSALLWCRPAVAAPIWSLAWEPPYAMSAALKSKKIKIK